MADIAELRIDLLHRNEDPAGKYTIEMRGQSGPVDWIAETGSFSLPAVVGANEDYGKNLFKALFVGDKPLEREFRQALADTVGRGLRLRVRLFIRSDPEGKLARHRWEMLCDPEDSRWLFTSDLLHFRRYLSFEGDIDTAPARTGPLRALVAIANPADLHDAWEVGDPQIGGRPTRIRVDDELQRASSSLNKLGADVQYLVSGPGSSVTAQALIGELDAGDGWDVVHLVCHGGFKQDGPDGPGFYLLLEGEGSPSDLVSVDRFVTVIRDQDPARRPRLVVLVSCQSGASRTSKNGDSLLGIGQRLVQEAGVLAAVAMQNDFTMDTAEIFLPAFFQALYDCDGNVEQAMAGARRQSSGRVDWYVPVLFARTWDGRLWPAASTIAGALARRRLEHRRVYVAHPAPSSAVETDLIESVKGILERSGFDVLASEPALLPGEGWGPRAVLDLGTCDGGVIIFTESALMSPSRAMLDEIRILCWRASLEPEFPVAALTLVADSADSLQSESWRFLCPVDADCIPSILGEAQREEIKTSLERLQAVVNRASPWGVQDLQAGLTGRIESLGIGQERLAQAIADLRNQGRFNMVISQEDAFGWWASALLCKGPVALKGLAENIKHRLDIPIREGLRILRDAVKPFWVDITAVSMIPRLLFVPDGQDDVRVRSFHLLLCHGMEPRDVELVAEWYLKRAFGLSGDTPERAVHVTLSGDDRTKLQLIREALTRTFGVDPSGDATLADYWLEDAGGGPQEGADSQSDTQLKERIAEKERQGQPVILLLPDKLLRNHTFLKDVRRHFGPIAFFFLGYGQQAANESGIHSLDPPLLEDDYRQTRNALQSLNDIL